MRDRLRLFAAVWLPRIVVDALQTSLPLDDARVRWTPAEKWHVTLRFLGLVARSDVDELLGVVAGVARGASAANAALGTATKCLGRGVLAVPVNGLAELAAAVVERTAAFGDPPDNRPFRGHITVARAPWRRRGGRPDEGAVADLRAYARIAIGSMAWPADELALVSSEGGRYVTLGQFPIPHRTGVRNYDSDRN